MPSSTRARCGAISALVADYDVVTACGITCDRIWWCECGTRVSAAVHGYVGPARRLRAPARLRPDPGGEGPLRTGPFESEAEVRGLPAVRQMYAAFTRDPGAGRMGPHNLGMISEAWTRPGWSSAPYDQRIARWLAG